MNDGLAALPRAANANAVTTALLAHPIEHRLLSVARDAREFVLPHAEAFRCLPVARNLRCGAWYFHGKLLGDDERWRVMDCWFKSVDGHFGKWNFSLKRMNMELLRAIVRHGGALVVDSTRHGKPLPDSFSKTIPIWCCVVNRAAGRLRGTDTELDGELHVPLFIPETERAQIEELLDSFVDRLLSTGPETASLLLSLPKPLRPLWSTPAAPLLSVPWSSDPSVLPFLPVILLQPSEPHPRPATLLGRSFRYLPGAGDDHEHWSRGLDPDGFWADEEAWLAGSISAGRGAGRARAAGVGGFAFLGGTGVAVGSWMGGMEWGEVKEAFDAAVNCTDRVVEDAPDRWPLLELGVPEGKGGRWKLQASFGRAVAFYGEHGANKKVLVFSERGDDRAPAIALAILLTYFSPDLDPLPAPIRGSDLTKGAVEVAIARIQGFWPRSAPSGASVRALRGWLFGRETGKGS
ncbi:initiator tRNA phosphoribosyl transferase-domain-containing protein [Hyaloraphidium curvatum]|nr:initiator tRNA phosphoribosyl transferase-domain-containing protein [Hyaloraphidium curvatum]